MSDYQLSDYRFELPEALIAQRPADRRDASRLMVVHLGDDRVEHRRFSDLPEYLDAGDLVVVNNTRVIPARLLGRRRTGAAVEVLLCSRLGDESSRRWEALVKPSKRVNEGEVIDLGEGDRVTLLTRHDGGLWTVEVEPEVIDRRGRAPLPPYIRRDRDEQAEQDRSRYQTVYARTAGAVAAPTAGLHFTESMIEQLRRDGVGFAEATLHVGIGTFRPIGSEDIRDHTMHSERYTLSGEAAEQVNRVRRQGGRVVACGTTSMRLLESAAAEDGTLPAGGVSGETDIFIYPPYRFRVTRSMITNFHLPGSTLLVMMSALVGRERMLELYRLAVEQRYRFFSYGDAMLVLGAS